MIIEAVVLEKLAALAELPTNDTKRLLPLAKLCISRLYARLKPGADTAENEEALSTVAAGMLLYQYATLSNTMQNESFKLGDLAISTDNGRVNVSDARALRDELFAGIAPLLLQNDAFLIQVK
ncbi:MAG: hypothetical protein RSB36_04030 [Hydrogenoanaerobacterium sp.]